MCDRVTSEDRIIIAVGQHDTNPLKIIAELCIFLKTIVCPVLILSVKNNIYLNEIKLNDMLELISIQSNDCEFVDLNSSSIFNICKTINSVLDQLDYNKRFLTFRAGSGLGGQGKGMSSARVSSKTQSTQTYDSSANQQVRDDGKKSSEKSFFRDL